MLNGQKCVCRNCNLAKSGQVIVEALSWTGVGPQLKSCECPAQVGTVGNYAMIASM